MGEAMFRGNGAMKGYLKNKRSTDKAFEGGCCHSGDLGVRGADDKWGETPSDYVELKPGAPTSAGELIALRERARNELTN